MQLRIETISKKDLRSALKIYNYYITNSYSNFEEKKLTFKDLLKSCDIGLSTVLLKKELINDEVCFANTKTKEDYILWLKVAKLGIEIEIINQSLSKWRKLNNSLSSSVSQKLYDGFLVYYKYMRFNVIKSIFYLIRLSIYSIQR